MQRDSRDRDSDDGDEDDSQAALPDTSDSHNAHEGPLVDVSGQVFPSTPHVYLRDKPET